MKRLVVLLCLLVCLPARAEDPGPAVVTVLEVANGRLVGNYLLDKTGRSELLKGSDPLLRKLAQPGGTELCLQSSPGAEKPRIEGFSLGILPTGERLFMREGSNLAAEGNGSLVAVDARNRVRVLVPTTHVLGVGASLWVREPKVTIAYPYLLSSDNDGVLCVDLRTNKGVWRSDWQLGTGRWPWGSWYHGGALYVQTSKGFARVDSGTGRIRWIYPDIGEVGVVRPGAPGQVILVSIYRSESMSERLTEVSKARFRQEPESQWIVPSGKSFYASTSTSEAVAVWEHSNGRWVCLFDYPKTTADSEIERLYTAHGFATTLRTQLTSPDRETSW